MFLGCIRFQLLIPHSRSLKQKRQILESIKQRIRNKFNVSVAEKPSEKWQHSELCLALVNYDKDYINSTFERIEEFIRFNNQIQILDIEKEVL